MTHNNSAQLHTNINTHAYTFYITDKVFVITVLFNPQHAAFLTKPLTLYKTP